MASSGSPGYLGVFTNSTDLGNSAIFQSGSSIGLNTTAPLAAFHTMATAAPGAYFDVYSNALGALPVVYRAARGTPGAPTAVQTDDILGGLAVRGYGATGFSGGQGQVMFRAAEPWTDAAHGTYLQFTTTPLGSAGWVERMRITPEGNVGLGTTTPGQKLSVAGTIESTTGGFKFPDGSTQATAVSLATNTFTGTQTITGGNLALPATAGATAGVLSLGGQSFLHAFGAPTNTFVGGQAGGGFGTWGSDNTAIGSMALFANTGGSGNTASGVNALSSNTTGEANTATGVNALSSNTTGFANTATGWWALHSNTTGSANTASGWRALSSNTTGYNNTASGMYSMLNNTTGYNNTASGYDALQNNTTGTSNTASGAAALYSNTTGTANTASGVNALSYNTTGLNNTANGVQALWFNTIGENNTASGRDALLSNTTGNENTASGRGALHYNTTGNYNTASGGSALYSNTTADNNTASGVHALYSNTTGFSNTADGSGALSSNTTGAANTASGVNALGNNTAGNGNIAMGYNAGSNLTTGSNNIHLGHLGVAAEGSTIRIGTGQTRTFIAGIRGVTTGGAAVAVLVDTMGQLGTASSSRRVKDDIADMGAASRALMTLRPVTFHYKTDRNPSGRTLQYGLIAEEVAEVYPGLVARSADGQIETVMYQFLPPMLLNEYQKQQRTIEAQAADLANQAARFDAKARALQAENEVLRAQLAALADRLARLETRDRH
jgi:hypothetical protein